MSLGAGHANGNRGVAAEAPVVAVHRVLEHPGLYNFAQWLFGAQRPRRYCIEEYGRAFDGARVVDIGCGPGRALNYLPDVEYCGFEPNPAYVAWAQRRFGVRARFVCGYFDRSAALELAPYDLVLLLGVVHHCDDETAGRLFEDIRAGLGPNGRVITLDPCITPEQSIWARYVARSDRGRHVRSPAEYRALAQQHLGVLASETRDGLLLIPTTVHIGAFGPA